MGALSYVDGADTAILPGDVNGSYGSKGRTDNRFFAP
jgi:hypothetical protein